MGKAPGRSNPRCPWWCVYVPKDKHKGPCRSDGPAREVEEHPERYGKPQAKIGGRASQIAGDLSD